MHALGTEEHEDVQDFVGDLFVPKIGRAGRGIVRWPA